MPFPCPLWTWERRVTEVSSGHCAVPLLYAPTPQSEGRGKHLLCLAAVRTLSSTSMGTLRNRWNFFLLGLVLGLTRQRGERRKPTCGKRVRSKFGFGSKVSKRPSASATKKFCNTKCTGTVRTLKDKTLPWGLIGRYSYWWVQVVFSPKLSRETNLHGHVPIFEHVIVF